MFAVASVALPHVMSGRLRGLGVTSPKPIPLVPGVPTLSGPGLPGFESAAVFALFAPSGIPAGTAQRLSTEIANVLYRPEGREKFIAGGIAPEKWSRPEEFTYTTRRDLGRMQKVIATTGMRDN
jgi:tripartite-type tricarboxylate transporter receptor subunit TctC